MHVVIDMGDKNTVLAAWREGQPLDDPSILVNLPGLNDSTTGVNDDPWSRASLYRHVTNLYREYLLPSRLSIRSLAAAIPDISGVPLRRTLLDVFEEVLGLEEAIIVPRFLAMAAGWQLHSPQSLGNIMVLDAQDEEEEVAFISACPDVTLTLEGQYPGNLRTIREAAARLGFLSSSGWNLDHLYLLNNVGANSQIRRLISGLPSRVTIHNGDNPGRAVMEGLVAHVYQGFSPGRLSVIYPFDFYLASFDQEEQMNSIHRLPFDTNNLELDCTSCYRLARLVTTDIPASEADPEQLRLGIFEIGHQDRIELDNLSLAQSILNIDCCRTDLPDRVDLILDMAAAVIRPDLDSGRDEGDLLDPASFWEHYHNRLSQDHTIGQLSTPAPDPSSSSSDPAVTFSPLDNQIAVTLARLQSLLGQWKHF